ncbi:glycosyltransferase family 2 protein [Kineococcus sp. SYSU DK005]|uniref:glycosyltransferase family 2 protein n=1 Tax=Kineococcus sp. SYSU DK005 TaxID=3383126 RepID=UPI003D7ECF13
MNAPLCVVICTHNRAPAAVAAVERLLAGDPAAPLLVVDSASSAEHAAALERFAAAHSSVRLVRCAEPGLAIARNTGVREAGAEWVAFVDDDIAVADDWWESARRAVIGAAADVGVIGGRILPRWPGARPQYVGWRWLMFLSCIEDIERPFKNGIQEAYGGNFLLRSAAWRDAGGYPENLGRIGDVLLSGEDNRLQYAVHESGWRVVFDASLVVEHLIPQERLTRGWIRRRSYWGGVSEVVGEPTTGPLPARLHPLKALGSFLVLRAASLVSDPKSDRYIRAHYARGVLVARLRRSRWNLTPS